MLPANGAGIIIVDPLEVLLTPFGMPMIVPDIRMESGSGAVW
jgi:hypothetical protein